MEETGEKKNTVPSATLPKAERLSGKNAIDALFREGAAGFVYPFRYIYTSVLQSGEESSEGYARILFSVPKRYHKRANKRNLLKRRIREAYRQAKAPLAQMLLPAGRNLHVVFIYSSKQVENYARINNAVRKIISEIQGRL